MPENDDILSAPPYTDEPPMPGRSRTGKRSRLTTALGAVLLLTVGFAGGVQTHKLFGGETTMRSGTPMPDQPRAMGRPGSMNRAAGGTTGTIKDVDGDTIYLETPAGEVIEVETDGSTRVSVATDGKLEDLKPGSSVIVQGQRTDNTMTADAVRQTTGG